MVKSKTKIGKQVERKSNKELVETILAAKKKKAWFEVSAILSGPRRKITSLNLGEMNEKAKEGDVIVVPGKVLSQGEINKKIKIVALGFSKKAKEKLEKAKVPFLTILEEIKKNPDAKDLKVMKK